MTESGIVMLSREVQNAKAMDSMRVTPSGMVMLFRNELYEKAPLMMYCVPWGIE